MKKKIIVSLIIALIILVPFVVYSFCNVSGSKIEEGTYYAVDCEKYPNAYIVVDGQTIRFYNIDLNKIYGDSQFEEVYNMQTREENPFDTGYTIDELKQMSDLNNIFCDNAYKYDLDKNHKQGTFVYWYSCMGEQELFGLQIIYDSWEETLKINNYQMEILFEKK